MRLTFDVFDTRLGMQNPNVFSTKSGLFVFQGESVKIEEKYSFSLNRKFRTFQKGTFVRQAMGQREQTNLFVLPSRDRVQGT